MADTGKRLWYEPLNEREYQILSLISDGHTNREIAGKLSLSLDTVKWYNKQLYSKLGVSSRTQAVSTARQHGLLDGLPSGPGRSGAELKHNLPHIPSSFIGRQREIAEIKHLLQSSRLVVLTGAGGSGKTRLALQVANSMLGYYPDGVWLVELAPLSDPVLLPNAIADALGVIQQGEAELRQTVSHYLQSRHLLLVMDNFEHLMEATPLVGELLASAPRITILATSRERLHVYGENEYPVMPLGLPLSGQASSIDQIIKVESAALFMERAQSVKQGFTLRPDEIAALARICLHLDGLPLALELAASRVKMFSLAALDERLSERLDLLTGGARDLPERQRTLRGAIDWSYDLLEDGERLLFARLAVFRGGGTLEAVERICGQDLPGDLLSLLSSLVDKSLVYVRDGGDGELRFEMLETIREYALVRLEASTERDSYNRKHGEYYAQLSERAAGELRYARQAFWFARLQSEYSNLRTALAWSLVGPEMESGLRITSALRDYWYYTGRLSEFKHWTNMALECMPDAPPELQAGVMMCAGHRHVLKGDPEQGNKLLLRAIDLFTQLGDERNVAWCRMFLSGLYLGQPDEYEEGIAVCIPCLDTFYRIGDLAGQAQALNILGEFTRLMGKLDESARYYEQCLQVVEQTGERLREGMIYANLGYLACRRGEYRIGLQSMRAFLHIADELKNDYGILTGIASISGPLAALGQPERAARLLGGAEAQLEIIGAVHQPSDLPEIEEYRREVYRKLGEEAFRAAWEEGSRMTIQEQIDLALEEV